MGYTGAMAAAVEASLIHRDITLTLDKDVFVEAEERGLLAPARLAALVQRELAFTRFDEIHAALDRLTPEQNPQMTMDEVQALIDCVRERRATDANVSGRR